jgi:nucleotide-binding universal stress UspA family protein
MKVLLAVDGSVHTRRMLAYLAAHDEFLGRAHDFTLLTVVPAVPPRAREFIDSTNVERYVVDEANAVLEPVARFAERSGWRHTLERRTGDPADAIVEAADAGGHDLVVMGSHGRSALGKLALGSVATRVLARCKTPVLIIR